VNIRRTLEMKITIQKKELKEALVNLSKIVSGRTALPIINPSFAVLKMTL
jgi:hypothetical protein